MVTISSAPPRAPRPGPNPAAPAPRRIRSRELFGSSREVRIDHEGVEYRLTRTRQGKLILTK
jgi:hemin uptake protein HemP